MACLGCSVVEWGLRFLLVINRHIEAAFGQLEYADNFICHIVTKLREQSTIAQVEKRQPAKLFEVHVTLPYPIGLMMTRL